MQECNNATQFVINITNVAYYLWPSGIVMARHENIFIVIGTRPEAIKMAHLILAYQEKSPETNVNVCITGQHRDLVMPVLKLFHINKYIAFDVMTHGQDLASLTGLLINKMTSEVRRIKPDCIVAQGDTTSVFAASLVAYYERIPFAHIEAGLRTYNLQSPFPEEMNRLVADLLSDFLFAPTDLAKMSLINEGVPSDKIYVTGNTVVDAARIVGNMPDSVSPLYEDEYHSDKRIVLVTTHRRESFGQTMNGICEAIRKLAQKYQRNNIVFIFPVHPNPNVKVTVETHLRDTENVMLIPPLDYHSLITLIKRSELILTDSGGLQEEAPTFGVPVFVMRQTTERPEGVESGVAVLVGTQPSNIINIASRFLDGNRLKRSSRKFINPYGDGYAADKIVDVLSGIN